MSFQLIKHIALLGLIIPNVSSSSHLDPLEKESLVFEGLDNNQSILWRFRRSSEKSGPKNSTSNESDPESNESSGTAENSGEANLTCSFKCGYRNGKLNQCKDTATAVDSNGAKKTFKGKCSWLVNYQLKSQPKICIVKQTFEKSKFQQRKRGMEM